MIGGEKKPSIKLVPFLTGEDGDDFHGKFRDFKGKPHEVPVFLDFEWFAFGAKKVW